MSIGLATSNNPTHTHAPPARWAIVSALAHHQITMGGTGEWASNRRWYLEAAVTVAALVSDNKFQFIATISGHFTQRPVTWENSPAGAIPRTAN
ncbi:hypothetical protein Dda_8568 [Drechslerella dactyloides]|uniref:Uncharacterized protein n=1 Tax=Drechslerella dactyloides TaxID=74499 RepID=A0AAD6NFZ2_DREDA|nr:hypothetical protein Dda_8568 [Drechslerella dactyloides]